MLNPRKINLNVAKSALDSKPMCAEVSFCESSASLTIDEKITIHIPWTEIAEWLRWLTETFEETA